MYRYYLEKLCRQLAIEYNCAPDDLLGAKNVLTVSALNDGRRRYSDEKPFLQMATLGFNTVITADEALHDFLGHYAGLRQGHRLFELPNLLPIEDELNSHGYTLSPTHHMFLPAREVTADPVYPVKWFFGEEILPFYGDARFPNAICAEFTPERPDRIVVCAYDGENIMGMAGCSEDAPHWQQIGIDVMPEYRSRGIGTYLVTLLKNKITDLGDIPFYGTAIGNYNSMNIALNSGFKPTWLELTAVRMK